MPYCPKCDMEFVEGITVCTDCGSPLYESQEAAMAAKKEEEEKSRQLFRETMEQLKEAAMDAEEDELEKSSASEPKKAAVSTVYVKKSSRYEDMKSSASAFLLMGCVTLLLAGICGIGILPVAASSRMVFTIIFALIGIGCLYIFWKTKKDAAVMKEAASEENKETEAIIAAFLSAHSGTQIDSQLAKDMAALGESLEDDSPEELSLKRYGLIQDYLVTEHDLPDPSYVDLLTEEIYNRLYP